MMAPEEARMNKKLLNEIAKKKADSPEKSQA
jgi:hypothetical protein